MSLTPSRSRAESPTGVSTDLAEVSVTRFGCVVRLPPEYSRAAVLELISRVGPTGAVVMGPADIAGLGSIGPEQWAVIAPQSQLRFGQSVGPAQLPDGRRVFVFPKHTLFIATSQVPWVQWALEAVKPERLDAEGRPLPWTEVAPGASAPSAEAGRDADALLDDSAVLPECTQPLGDDEGAVVATSTIREWFAQLCAATGFPSVPLIVRRGRTDARGFVAGSVELTSQFVPRRIVLTTCPNADQAEIVATLLHEMAHPLARTCDHGPAFCQTLVDLASRVWGEAYAAGARAHLGSAYALIDRWVTCGARAALAGREPPARKVCDDGHAARVVSKIAKLWALAADQVGKPEAIGATALANDLLTLYGLDRSQIGAAPALDDRMIDRWVLLTPRQPWQRELAHAVADFNGVYSLSMDAKARMHFFGRYSDIVAAEYLCVISIERIQRECAAHLDKLRGLGVSGGELRKASTAFCDSAVHEFARKLDRITEAAALAAGEGSEQAKALEESKQFAAHLLGQRGIRVGTGRSRRSHHSEEGAEAGRRMQVVRGLDAQGGVPLALPDRRGE